MKTARMLAACLVLLAAALVPPARALAQESGGTQVDPRLDSPRSTMRTFLTGVNDAYEERQQGWESAVLCLDLSGVTHSRAASERELVQMLWGALNRIRLIELERLPGPNELEPGESDYLFFPRPLDRGDEAILSRIEHGGQRIALARQADGRWLFSAATMSGLPDLYSALRPLTSMLDVDETALRTTPLLREFMPAPLIEGELLDLEYWQWLGLLGLALFGKLVDLFIRRGLGPVVRRVARRYHGEASDEAVRQFLRPLGLLGTGLVWLAFIRTLGFGGAALEVLLAAIRAFTILSGTWAGWRLADLGAEVLARKAHGTESTIDDVLVPLLRQTAKLFIVAFGLVYAAQSLHFNIVPLITGLGIGGLAFAFAAKDTIENLFGSIAVILDRPFEVGDWVVVGDTEGTVEDLGFRSTRVRTFYNSQVTVPNSQLVRAVVDNYGRRRYRRWRTIVGVQYDTPPDKLLSFTEGIRQLVRSHPYTRKDYFQVWCNDFADSSLNILLYIFFEVPDWSTELRERERLFIDVVRLADRLGVQFAFPTQTVHLHSGETPSERPEYAPPDGKSDRVALAAGVRAAREIVRGQPWRDEPPGPVNFGQTDANIDIDDPLETTEDTQYRKRSAESPPG